MKMMKLPPALLDFSIPTPLLKKIPILKTNLPGIKIINTTLELSHPPNPLINI